MPIDNYQLRGPTKASQPSAGKSVVYNVPYFGIVKNNADSVRTGRLQVYISDFGNPDPTDANGWTTVRYLPLFYGRTDSNSGDTGYGSFKTNPDAYGMWSSPPDIGTTVVCIFVNGDVNYGFWIGCVPEAEALYSVPAIGASPYIIGNQAEADSYGNAPKLPVTNLNVNNKGIVDTDDFLEKARPIHSYIASTYAKQGLLRDSVRGPISSSAQRETPSRVGWGISTPGRPIYSGGYDDSTLVDALLTTTPNEKLKVVGRRGGHSIVMDDGDIVGKDQLIRLRTALGHQILMSDDGQTLHIIHSNGQSWIELGKEGTIDLYSTNSVNVRTQGDLNLHADNNININAAKAFNLYAESINLESTKDTKIKVEGNYNAYIMKNFTVKVNSAISMLSTGEGSYASDATLYVNGKDRVNLNTGSASLVPAEVPAIDKKLHTDTLYDSVKGWAAAPVKLLSITSRAPAHAPWANAGLGVDVKINNNASSSLPSAPNTNVQATNNLASNQIGPEISQGTLASVPSVPVTSASINGPITGAMIAASATDAASGLGGELIKDNNAVKSITDGVTSASIGTLGQSPEQLEAAGFLKPGSAKRANALIQAESSIEDALPPNMWTGKNGITNLSSYLNSKDAQIAGASANIKKSQDGLIKAGILSGKEAGTAIAGTVFAAAKNGVSAVTGVIKDGVSAVGGASTKILESISSGNFAAGFAEKIQGSLASISTSLDSAGQLLAKTKGLATQAFASITAGLKSFKAGIPQNLTELAKQNKEESLAADITLPVNEGETVLAGVANATGITPPIIPTAISEPLSGSVAQAANASGLSAIPGGTTATAFVKDAAKSASDQIPSLTASVGSLLKDTQTAITNKLSLDNITTQFSPEALGNLAKNALGGLNVGSAAKIVAALGSISSSVASKVSTPVTATDTVDTKEQEAQTDAVIGDPSIPKPNYKGLSEEDANKTEELNKRRKELNEEAAKVLREAQQNGKELANAKAALQAASQTLPIGDPQIITIENDISLLNQKKTELISKAKTINQESKSLQG